MSDGVMLAALRFPAPTPPAPAIVMLTPYPRKEVLGKILGDLELDQLGCDIVVADCRGVGGSQGDWDGPFSPQEISDGSELLEWIAHQGFCNGTTALYGGSYTGHNALLIAARRPRGLSCVIAVVPPIDVYRDMWHRGAIASLTNWGVLAGYSNQHRPDAQQRVLDDFYMVTVAEPFDGERCQSRSAEYVLDKIEAPTLLVGGWYDFFLRATLRAFKGVRAPKRLVIGNWGHVWDTPTIKQETARWFRYWLHGVGADPTDEPHVVLQSVGTNAWISLMRWPTAAEINFERWRPVATPISIRTVAHVGEVRPTSQHPLGLVDNLAASGLRIWGEAWTADTPLFAAEVSLRGPVALKAVIVSEEAADLDLYARLSIVRADGLVEQLTEGRLRASHRALDPSRSELSADNDTAVPWHPHERADPLRSGIPEVLDIEIFPINLDLTPGERLRLGMTLVRTDAVVDPTDVTLLPETHVLLPYAVE